MMIPPTLLPHVHHIDSWQCHPKRRLPCLPKAWACAAADTPFPRFESTLAGMLMARGRRHERGDLPFPGHKMPRDSTTR
jgi:hypothetical protein